MWGLTQSTLVSTPVMDMGLEPSNSAANEWCANVPGANPSEAKIPKNMDHFLIFIFEISHGSIRMEKPADLKSCHRQIQLAHKTILCGISPPLREFLPRPQHY